MLNYENGVKALNRLKFFEQDSATVKTMLGQWYEDGGITETTYYRLMAYVCQFYERRRRI